MSYDPAFLNTASGKNRITFIDGEKKIFRYRGYPIQEIADRSSFLEVAFLLIHGELPNPSQLNGWLIAKMPAIAAYTLRHRLGWPYVYPDSELSYAGNFLSMMFKRT